MESTTFLGNLQFVVDQGVDHLEGHLVFAAVRYDDIGIAFGGFDELQVHRAYKFFVLLQHAFQAAFTFDDIAVDAAQQADIVVGIHEQLDVHQLAQLLLAEDQNTVDEDYFTWMYFLRFLAANVFGKIVDGHVYAVAFHQGVDVPDQQLGLERRRVVEILFGTLFEGQMLEVAVVRVVLQHDDVILPDRVYNMVDDRSFAGSASSGHAYNDGLNIVHVMLVGGEVLAFFVFVLVVANGAEYGRSHDRLAIIAGQESRFRGVRNKTQFS